MPKGYGVSFCHDENVLTLAAGMAAQFCEYIKNTEVHSLNKANCSSGKPLLVLAAV